MSPALIRFLGSEAFQCRRDHDNDPIDVRNIPDEIGKFRLRNATLNGEVNVSEVNDLFGTFGNPMELFEMSRSRGCPVRAGAGVLQVFQTLAFRNKTGTFREAVLYVDNRGSWGSRGRRAYRVSSRRSQQVPRIPELWAEDLSVWQRRVICQ